MILYTGFKGDCNSSCILVCRIQGEKLFLTNSFDGLKRDIENIKKKYEKIYMFGLDARLKKSVRIEECAEKEGVRLYSEMDLADLQRKIIERGISCSISGNPTHYLCNEAYYHMLMKYQCHAVFIHIPPLKYITDEMMKDIIEVVQE